MEKLTKDPCASMGLPPKDVLQKFATQYSRQNPNPSNPTERIPFRKTNSENPHNSTSPKQMHEEQQREANANTSTPEDGIYANENVDDLNARLASYRSCTSITRRDWRDLPTAHHPTGYNTPPFRPGEWRGRSWTKDDNLQDC